MATRDDLKDWILDALEEMQGRGTIVDVSRAIWLAHREDLDLSGDLFYTWQYDIRWAASDLKKAGRLTSVRTPRGAQWQLVD